MGEERMTYARRKDIGERKRRSKFVVWNESVKS